MEKNKIDITISSETEINQDSKEIHDDYTFVFLSGVIREQAERAEKDKNINYG